MNNTSELEDDAAIKTNASFTKWSAAGKLSFENQVAITLWQVWSPCLLLFGGLGNIATILFVMRRNRDSNSSQHIILMALAASDFSLLYVSVLRQWLYFLLHVDVYDLHTVVCKLSWWLIYVSGSTSSWLLTCVTVQRTMAVKWPHKMKMMCSMRRTWTVIAVVFFAACAIHFHFVVGMEISRDKCFYTSVRYKDFVRRVWGWVDLTTLSVIPSVCLLVCDVILSSTLFEATSTTSMIHSVSNANTACNSSRRKTASRTTIMILAVSCTFLVLTLPVCVYLIWDHYAYIHITQGDRLWTRKTIPFAVTMLLWYTNSAVNFLLYYFTGTKFRREFLNWFCCGTQRQSSESVCKTVSGTLSGRKDDHTIKKLMSKL